MLRHAVILAGGSGTRLWPASSAERPKQFLKLDGISSLLGLAAERARRSCPGEIVVVTHERLAEASAADLAEFPEPDRLVVLAEPAARNTAPAIALGVEYLRRRYGGSEPVITLTADHIIRPLQVFAEDAAAAGRLADRGFIVVFGVPPRDANTGYGYVEAGEDLGDGLRVASFKEKPDAATAERYVAAGRFLWNSGMFVFTAERLSTELGRRAPAIASAVANAVFRVKTTGASGISLVEIEPAGRAVYEGLPSISMDYAVMEKCGEVAAVRARFDWNDVGSWDEVAALVAGGDHVWSVGGGDNFVLSDLPVGLCGVSDLIVVVSNGRVLVCSKGASQSVKELAVQAEKQE